MAIARTIGRVIEIVFSFSECRLVIIFPLYAVSVNSGNRVLLFSARCRTVCVPEELNLNFLYTRTGVSLRKIIPLTLAALALMATFSACEIAFFLIDGSGGGGTVSYTVTYIGNGNTAGSAPYDEKSYSAGAVITIASPAAEFERTGSLFNGWTENADGSGTVYTPNQLVTASKNLTLYARWISNGTAVYRIHYDNNSAVAGLVTGTVPADATWYTAGQYATIAENTGNLSVEGKVFTNWNTQPSASGISYEPGTRFAMPASNITLYAQFDEGRLFNAYDFATNQGYTFTGELLGKSAHSLVYADAALNFSPAMAQSIATEFESDIYPKMISNFGEWDDVDGNGKLTILLFDIRDGYVEGSGGGYYAGYFNPADMFSTSTYPASNVADMINMDVNPLEPGSVGFHSTIAHEMQHLINFSVNVSERVGDGLPEIDVDTWLNEGLSAAAEYVYAGEVDGDRIDYYNYVQGSTIIAGNNFFVWDGYWEQEYGDVLADYTTVYMFFQWLRIHADNGTAIYKEILHSGEPGTLAVTAYAATRIDSQFGSWPVLLRTWYAANLCNDPSGYYGYEGALGSLAKLVYEPDPSDQSWAFAPGEGIVTGLDLEDGFTPGTGGTHVSYAGITDGLLASGTSLDTGAPYFGEYSLVLNGNTAVSGADEIGLFPVSDTVVASSRNLSTQPASRPQPVGERNLPAPYPIDPVFGPDGIPLGIGR